MVTFEYLAAADFLLIGLLAPFSGAPPRRWVAVGVMAIGLAAAVVAMAVFSVKVRGWMGHAYLVAGYWLPALLVARQPGAFESWLRSAESRAARTVGVAEPTRSALLSAGAEMAYLCAYPLVPAAFVTVSINGSAADVDRFWTSVLGAGYLCYVSLPWLVSRPPRAIEETVPIGSHVRTVNLHVLDRFSHGWNTFPSGHVAVAFAAALLARDVAPAAGMAFAVVALGVAAGAVVGRYHYLIDALAGVAVAGLAYVISRAIP